MARFLRPEWTCERTETNIRNSFAYLVKCAMLEPAHRALAVRRYRKLESLDLDATVAFNQWMHNIACDHRLVRMYSTIHIYANDLSFLPHLEQLQVDYPNMVYDLRAQQAQVVIPRDEIWQIFPRHSLRTYLSLTSPIQNKDLLCDFLQHWGDEVRVSPGLKAWFRHEGRLTARSTYFVDHNHATILTAIGVISPGIVGQTVTIRTRPS